MPLDTPAPKAVAQANAALHEGLVVLDREGRAYREAKAELERAPALDRLTDRERVAAGRPIRSLPTTSASRLGRAAYLRTLRAADDDVRDGRFALARAVAEVYDGWLGDSETPAQLNDDLRGLLGAGRRVRSWRGRRGGRRRFARAPA